MESTTPGNLTPEEYQEMDEELKGLLESLQTLWNSHPSYLERQHLLGEVMKQGLGVLFIETMRVSDMKNALERVKRTIEEEETA